MFMWQCLLLCLACGTQEMLVEGTSSEVRLGAKVFVSKWEQKMAPGRRSLRPSLGCKLGPERTVASEKEEMKTMSAHLGGRLKTEILSLDNA